MLDILRNPFARERKSVCSVCYNLIKVFIIKNELCRQCPSSHNSSGFSVLGRSKCMCGSSHALCYGRVWSIILLPWMTGRSFLLVVLTRLIVSEPKHWVTWSQTTGVHFPFLRVGGGGGGGRIQFCVCAQPAHF